jgi:Ca2+-binding EF-hand superfamily protein
MYQIFDRRSFKVKKFKKIYRPVPFNATTDEMLEALSEMKNRLKDRFPGLKLRVYKETEKETKLRLETEKVFSLLENARKKSKGGKK